MPAKQPMTGQEIIDFFETIIDDSIDETAALLLMNNAKDKIEGEREWEILKTTDSSQSASSSAIPLPADFERPTNGIIFVGTQPYWQVPFEQKQLIAQGSQKWYLDLKNDRYYVVGANSGTIYFPYIYQTDEITLGTSPVWPPKYHLLLAFEMAELFFAIDQGERPRSWDDKWAIQYQVLKRSMIDWDVKLQRRAIENSIPLDANADFDLGMM